MILIADLYQKLQPKTTQIVNIYSDKEPCKYEDAERFVYYYYYCCYYYYYYYYYYYCRWKPLIVTHHFINFNGQRLCGSRDR